LYGLDNFLTYLVWGANKTSVYGDVHTATKLTQTVKGDYCLWPGLANNGKGWAAN
jgi:hypothetical protein